MFESSTTTLIVANDEVNDIMKTIKSLEEPRLLIKSVSQTIKIKQKNKKEDLSECYNTL